MKQTILILLAVILSGCTVTRSSQQEDESATFNLGPIIGLIGIAVDGDDKDDYEHFFHDHDCCCRHCR